MRYNSYVVRLGLVGGFSQKVDDCISWNGKGNSIHF